MSMRGSPINWWKEKRQSSHTGIPPSSRPATAFPFDENNELKKIIEEAVLSAFENNAFKIAVASQVEPAFLRQQEKLNQIKAANLNLESTLQAHVEDFPAMLKPIQDHMTSFVIPQYGQELERLSMGQERLESHFHDLNFPDYQKELSEISSGQARLLKLVESRFGSLESRIDEFDRKLDTLDESVVNSDLRSAIRFGEISNELQDRNATLCDRVWEMERNLGRKVDGQQRKVVSACEELGNAVRSTSEALEAIQTKIETDDVFAVLKKATSRAETSELTLRQHIVAIQDKLANIDTSAIPSQSRKLEVIEREMSEIKKSLELAGNLASLDSKLLSANTSRLDSIVSTVGEIQTVAESTYEISRNISESQELNAASAKEDDEAVRMHIKSLDTLAVSHSGKLTDVTSSLSRIEESGLDHRTAAAEKLDNLGLRMERIEKSLASVSSHTTKLNDIESTLGCMYKDRQPERTILDNLKSELSDMRSTIDAMLSSQDASLKTIQHEMSDTSSLDHLTSRLSEMQTTLEQKLASSSEIIQNDTSKVLTALDDSRTATAKDHDLLKKDLSSITQDTTLAREVLTMHTEIIEGLVEKAKSILDVATYTKKSSEAHSAILDSLAVSSASVVEASTSTKDALSTQSDLINILSSNLTALQSNSDADLKQALLSLEFLKAGFGERTLHSELQDLASNVRAQTTLFDEVKQGNDVSVATLQNIQDRQHHDTTSIETNLGRSIEALQKELSTSIEGLQKATFQGNSSWKEDVELMQTKLGAIAKLSEENCRTGASQDDIVLLESKLGTVIVTLEGFNKSMSHKEDVERMQKDLNSSLQGLQETALNSHTSRNEEIAALQTSILQALQRNDSTLQEIAEFKSIAELSTRLNEFAASVSKEISTMDSNINSTSISTIKEIADRIGGLDRKFRTDLESVEKAADLRAEKLRAPIAEVLQEVRTSKALLEMEKAEIVAELQSTNSSIEASKSANSSDIATIAGMLHKAQEVSKDEEILLQIESWGQNILSKQATDISALTELLQASRTGGDALKQSLTDISLDLSTAISTSANTLVAEVQKIDLASTNTALESLKGDIHASSRTIHDNGKLLAEDIKSYMESSIISVSEAVKSSSDAHKKALQESVLNLEEVSKTNTGLLSEGLAAIQQSLNPVPETKNDVKLILASMKELDQNIKSNAGSLAIIEGLVATASGQLGTISGEMKAALDTHADETLQTVKANHSALLNDQESSRRQLGKIHDDILALSNLFTHENDDLKITMIRDLEAVKVEIISGMDEINGRVDKATIESKKAHETTLAKVMSENKSLADIVCQEAHSTIKALNLVKEFVESESQTTKSSLKSSIGLVSTDLRTISTAIREDIERLDNKTIDKFIDLETSVKANSDTLSSSVEDTRISLQSALSTVSSSQKAIDAAVRVNSAAISRVDKAVLETGSQVKNVVRDAVADSNHQLIHTITQLDSELHDSGTRIRGISEYDIPRLEAIEKRNRDALEVIGGRVLGTTKKFGEMVTKHAQKLPISMEDSGLLGSRLRSPSVASSRGSRGDE